MFLSKLGFPAQKRLRVYDTIFSGYAFEPSKRTAKTDDPAFINVKEEDFDHLVFDLDASRFNSDKHEPYPSLVDLITCVPSHFNTDSEGDKDSNSGLKRCADSSNDGIVGDGNRNGSGDVHRDMSGPYGLRPRKPVFSAH